jgi:outer membrane protein TolC
LVLNSKDENKFESSVNKLSILVCLRFVLILVLVTQNFFSGQMVDAAQTVDESQQLVSDPEAKKFVSQSINQSTSTGSFGKLPSINTYPFATPAEDITLQLPRSSELLPVGPNMPPIRLEANFTEPITLREALVYALDHNLPININRANVQVQRWTWLSAMGNFLPNYVSSYTQQHLSGATLVGGIIPVTFNTPNVQAQAGFQYYGFQGGRVMFTMLQNKHNWQASKQQLFASVNDNFLAVAQAYYNLLRAEAVLTIQIRAVETSKTQVDLNQKLERAGTGTRFNVLQSQTQLATDEQNLLNAEVALRQAALALGVLLNQDLSGNMICVENVVKKVRLIDPRLNINDLINIACAHRPELKQYEQLRLAARRTIQVQAAPLYPQFLFYGNINGNGQTLGNSQQLVPGSFSTVLLQGPVAGPPIPSPTSRGTPIVEGNNNGFSGTATPFLQMFPTADVWTPPSFISRQMRASYTIGMQLIWNWTGLGAPAAANIQAAKAQARLVSLQENQQLLSVLNQVRNSFINSNLAEKQIDVASVAVLSSSEQLRLAQVRLANGVGTNLDVVAAQQAWVQALVNKANAIIQFNVAQAQLLRDLGVINIETLTSGRLLNK